MKAIVQKLLHFFAIQILKKYKPEIIAVTGSVGKTATKEAIYAVLKDEFDVRRSEKNYNTEFGVPVSIIGADFPGRSVIRWIALFLQAISLLVSQKPYPKILVLEMALDKPGDLEYLTNMAPPNIGVVTMIGNEAPVHSGFFQNIGQLVQEKMKVATKISKKGFAVLNRDDKRIWDYASKVQAHIISFGFDEKADIRASYVNLSEMLDAESPASGINFKLSHQGATIPALLPDALGKHQIYAALAAAAVGKAYDIRLTTIIERLKNIPAPRGRMSLLKGVKHTTIIDDTYNSSPVACRAALEVLGQSRARGRKFAVLADMLELGKHTDAAHQSIGKEVVAQKIDFLVTVGEKARVMGNAAAAAGMNRDHVFEFADAESAGRFVQERMEEGDLILVKGSQSMRMEKVVKEIMAEPMRANELLVRQEGKWME